MKKNSIILSLLFSALLYSCATKQEKLEGIWLFTNVDGKDVSEKDIKLNLGKDGVAVIASKGIVGTWVLTSDESTIELRESRRKSAEKLTIVTLTSDELVVVVKDDTTKLKKVKE
jgi:hypothetical protein